MNIHSLGAKMSQTEMTAAKLSSSLIIFQSIGEEYEIKKMKIIRL